MTDPLQSTDDYRPCRFARVLRDARLAIPPEAVSLGNVLRLPCRVGKAVSQEEVAEAVGISRVWYVRLETGRSVRTSVALLERLANALMLNDTQRAELFPFAAARIAMVLRHGSVLAGSALTGAALPAGALAENSSDKNLPPNVPEWMQSPGADVGSEPYGTPSLSLAWTS